MKILLISGHGAGDPGATGNGYKEADLTRELVNLIAPKLRKYATVDIYNQSRNAFKDCQAGTFSIGSYDYVLEVHFNAFNGSAYGTEIYVTDREKGVTVEQAIMDEMGTYFVKRGSTGVKVTNFLVINTVKSKGISSALLETCFIDNKNDMRIYEANKDRIAQAVVNGIVKGFGLTADNTNTGTTPPAKNNLYKVQTGAFKEKKNAESLATKLKALGYSTYIVNEGGLYKVQTGAFSKKENAVEFQNKLKAKGFDSFIKM